MTPAFSTTMDHSSPHTLAAELERYRQYGLFRFERPEDGAPGKPWQLVSVVAFDSTTICFRVEFQDGVTEENTCSLLNPWLYFAEKVGAWVVTHLPDKLISDTLKRADTRRDKGLADIFG